MESILSKTQSHHLNDDMLLHNAKGEFAKLIARTTNIGEGKPNDVRNEIRDYFLKTYEVDDLVYKQLRSNEVLYKRGDPLRHIILFYLGHTAAFFINKLFLAKVIKSRVNEHMESIMAIGVDEMSWDDLNNANYDWPKAEEVYEYRKKVKDVVLNLIEALPLQIPVTWDSPFWIIMMGIEHQRIHIETSSVLLRQLPIEDLISGVFGEICKRSGPPPANELIAAPGGKITLGRPKEGREYGWDMEYGHLECEVKPFQVSKFLCSNGEFYQFVKEGGYQNKDFWTGEGWTWVQFKKACHPLFWLPGNAKEEKNGLPTDYKLRLVADVISMPWDWPVEVNQLEAAAFCAWKSAKEGKQIRLITEAEWFLLFDHAGIPDQLDWSGGAPGNINLEHFSSPCPVDMFKHGKIYDALGNVWQHTSTVLNSFPGFEVHPVYDDFSVPTFDGKHNMIKGGSWISTGNEALRNARYAFRRHFYQHAGFRYASGGGETVADARAGNEADVRRQITAQWGLDNSQYHQNLIDVVKQLKANFTDKKDVKVCDLNTDTGRFAFELINQIPELKITAIDLTTRMLKNAFELQENLKATFHGDGKYKDMEIDLPAMKLGHKHLKGIFFTQDNAMNLKAIHKDFDIVVHQWFENVIDQELYLQNAGDRIAKGGYLVLITDIQNKEFNTKDKQEALLKQFKFVSEQKVMYKQLDKDVEGTLTVWQLK